MHQALSKDSNARQTCCEGMAGPVDTAPESLHVPRAGKRYFGTSLSCAETVVYAQVVLSWQDSAGRTLRRVVTRKLQTTTVLSAYVRDVDVPLAAVLLAKGVVQDAVRSEAAAHGELAPIRASIGESLPCWG